MTYVHKFPEQINTHKKQTRKNKHIWITTSKANKTWQFLYCFSRQKSVYFRTSHIFMLVVWTSNYLLEYLIYIYWDLGGCVHNLPIKNHISILLPGKFKIKIICNSLAEKLLLTRPPETSVDFKNWTRNNLFIVKPAFF